MKSRKILGLLTGLNTINNMSRQALSKEEKKTISKVADQKFAEDLIKIELPKHYPDFKTLESLELTTYKNHYGRTSAVFVVEYFVRYLDKDDKEQELDLFCSAHTDGSREGAYLKTKFLYEQGFDKGKYRVAKPLFFVPEQKAFVYVASEGDSLFNFFKKDTEANLDSVFKLSAGWIRKLHGFDLEKNKFDWPDFRIANMVPSPEKFITDFSNDNQKQGDLVASLYKQMHNLELEYQSEYPQTLIYGDYHPENIIIKGLDAQELEMIDFTDLALGDPMVDLGAFIQQFDFMGHNFISREKINHYKRLFVEAYFEEELDKISEDYIKRINLYQAWTALRTAIFLFYMKDIDNPINDLLSDCENYLKLSLNKEKKVNLH